MKQLIQSFRTGASSVAEVPAPIAQLGQVVVRVAASLVSAGTERSLLNLAEKNILQKAVARPDIVRQAVDKACREGVLAAFRAVRSRLDQPLRIGYSCAGTVIGVGGGVSDIQLGDRVACAGGGYAVHAEVISVPTRLVVKLPENVDFESAASTTLGAIALHGLHLAEVGLGETVAVIGLGLLGQLTVQLLKVAGCTVLGIDIQPARAELALQLGADAVATDANGILPIIHGLSCGYGADAVLITADTPRNQPLELAGLIARDRARIVAVGAVGMTVPRRLYYKKELDFRISRSYGPGRYDSDYEEKGHDYPIGYVRWTENRNMEAFTRLLDKGKMDVKPLITHRFPIEEAPQAYDLITGRRGEAFLGVLITYPQEPDLRHKILLKGTVQTPHIMQYVSHHNAKCVRIGLLGAGNFASATLLPAMKKVPSIEFIGACSATGLSARHAGDKFDFRYCTTDENEILNDREINTVVIATRHHLHARQLISALNAGKHVHCEKPLALNEDELREIVQVASWEAKGASVSHSGMSTPLLIVGFNRRFAPMARQLKAFLSDVHEPLVMHYRINAGYIPPDHWVHDPAQGGGRIVGEVCHFVDLLTFLACALPARVYARTLPNASQYRDDNVVITLEFSNGSLGTITYVANGDKSLPKERVEVFGGGAVAVLDDFRRLDMVRDGHKKVYKSRLHQDKGHQAEWEAFVNALITGGPIPISFQEIISTTLTTFRILDALQCREAVEVNTEAFIASALAGKEK
jgi:predicted dehydrogenase/threonine dehydrogenase-like Zn-dependent dehydrogenase